MHVSDPEHLSLHIQNSFIHMNDSYSIDYLILNCLIIFQVQKPILFSQVYFFKVVEV